MVFCLQLIGKVLQEIFSAASLTICWRGGGGGGVGTAWEFSENVLKKPNYQIKNFPLIQNVGQRKRLGWSVIHKSTDRGEYGAANKKFGQRI